MNHGAREERLREQLAELEVNVYAFDHETARVWCGDEQGGAYGAASVESVERALEYARTIDPGTHELGELPARFAAFHDRARFDRSSIPPELPQ